MKKLFAVAALAAAMVPAYAVPVLYAISGAGNATSNLYTVNTSTGAATLVGSTGFSTVTGLAFNPITGVLYGHVSDIFGSPSNNQSDYDQPDHWCGFGDRQHGSADSRYDLRWQRDPVCVVGVFNQCLY